MPYVVNTQRWAFRSFPWRLSLVGCPSNEKFKLVKIIRLMWPFNAHNHHWGCWRSDWYEPHSHTGCLITEDNHATITLRSNACVLTSETPSQRPVSYAVLNTNKTLTDAEIIWSFPEFRLHHLPTLSLLPSSCHEIPLTFLFLANYWPLIFTCISMTSDPGHDPYPPITWPR